MLKNWQGCGEKKKCAEVSGYVWVLAMAVSHRLEVRCIGAWQLLGFSSRYGQDSYFNVLLLKRLEIKLKAPELWGYGELVVIAWELLVVATTILNCDSWFWVMEMLAEVGDLFDVLVQLDQIMTDSMTQPWFQHLLTSECMVGGHLYN